MSQNEGREGAHCKVDTLVAEYELSELDDDLADRWTRPDDRYSLRALADYVNRNVLQREMERHDLSPLEGEVENLYRLLTDDDVTGGMRTQARRRLERADIDVGAVEDDFVSHQTVYRHLTECLSVSHESETDETDQVEKGIQKIRGVQNRTRAVTEDTLEQLRNTDRIDLDGFDVFVDVTVMCSDCGTHQDVSDLLEANGCDCQQ